ncbi:MAG: ATP-binding protein [Mariniblastus sp.]
MTPKLLIVLCLTLPTFAAGGQGDYTHPSSITRSKMDGPSSPAARESDAEFIERITNSSTATLDEASFQDAVRRTVSLSQSAEFEAALAMAEVAINFERTNSDQAVFGRLYLYKALAEMNLGDFVKAIDSLRYAEALEQDQPKQLSVVSNFLGQCLRKIGNEQEALKALKRALEKSNESNYHKLDFEIHSNLGYLLLSLGKIDEAEFHLKSLLPDSPDENRLAFASANLGLGEIALVRDQYSKARSHAQKAIEACDLDSDLFLERAQMGKLLIGRSYLAERNFKLATEYCRSAADEVPKNSTYYDKARIHLGLALSGDGNLNDGLDLIKQVATDSADIDNRRAACKELVEYFSARNQFKSALQYEKELRLIDQEQAESRLNLAESQFIPRLVVNRLRMIANEEKSNAIAEKAKSEQAKMQAQQSKREASQNRLIRNLVIWCSGLILLGCIFVFRSQVRIRQTKVELVESRKRVELERQLAHKRRIESIGHLTGNVAHDFNNILQVVSCSNQLLEASLNNDTADLQRRLLASASDAVDLGARITSQLLSFAGQQQYAPEPTKATKIFESSSLLFSSVGGDEIKIELEDLTPDLVVNVDRSQLSNALLNLLVNARRAMDGKGIVKIRLTEFLSDTDPTSPDPSQELFLKIEVIDTGCGMSREEVERACEPYYTTKPNETGSGLGLSSVKGCVDQLGGRLEIKSQKGVGTCVSLFIPATIDNFLEGEQVTIGESAKLTTIDSVRCLVVEDNPSVQISMIAFLENLGVQCSRCRTADEAHVLLQNDSNFQIVISDIRMPGKWDGADLARWITENFNNISTILISGNEAPLHVEKCMFLRKPFRFDELQKAISASLKAVALPTKA